MFCSKFIYHQLQKPFLCCFPDSFICMFVNFFESVTMAVIYVDIVLAAASYLLPFPFYYVCLGCILYSSNKKRTTY